MIKLFSLNWSTKQYICTLQPYTFVLGVLVSFTGREREKKNVSFSLPSSVSIMLLCVESISQYIRVCQVHDRFFSKLTCQELTWNLRLPKLQKAVHAHTLYDNNIIIKVQGIYA